MSLECLQISATLSPAIGNAINGEVCNKRSLSDTSPQQPMPKGFHKHKILLDKNMPQRSRLPLLNQQFDVKHIRDDRGLGELEDPQVYELAVKEGRVLATFNTKHF